MAGLLPVAEAQQRLLALATTLPAEQVPLAQATGRWLREDLKALRDQPASDLSAMDGYAIRFADLPGPWEISGTSAAGGETPPAIAAGQATRIFTGAPLPQGADTVIIQEDVSAEGNRLTLDAEPPKAPGKHVRPRASDFAQDSIIIPAGTRLTAAHIALAALAGHASLPVARKPRIALLATGSELVEPGQPIGPGQLPASNSVMLAAMLAELPCEVIDLGIIRDDLAAITEALREAAKADIVVTTGGASVGDHDLVKPALAAAGGAVDFWKIAMRPGKPLICGTLGSALFLGLPGNPVSAFVTATLFLLPLVRHMAGSRTPLPAMQQAKAGADFRAQGARAEYLRAILADGIATPVYHQDSAATHALSLADCLIVRPADAPALANGGDVPVILLPR